MNSAAVEASSAVCMKKRASVNQPRACRGLKAAPVCDAAHTEQMSSPLANKNPVSHPEFWPMKLAEPGRGEQGTEEAQASSGLPPQNNAMLLCLFWASLVSWRNVKAMKYRCPWETEEHSCPQPLELSLCSLAIITSSPLTRSSASSFQNTTVDLCFSNHDLMKHEIPSSTALTPPCYFHFSLLKRFCALSFLLIAKKKKKTRKKRHDEKTRCKAIIFQSP